MQLSFFGKRWPNFAGNVAQIDCGSPILDVVPRLNFRLYSRDAGGEMRCRTRRFTNDSAVHAKLLRHSSTYQS